MMHLHKIYPSGLIWNHLFDYVKATSVNTNFDFLVLKAFVSVTSCLIENFLGFKMIWVSWIVCLENRVECFIHHDIIFSSFSTTVHAICTVKCGASFVNKIKLFKRKKQHLKFSKSEGFQNLLSGLKLCLILSK